MGLLCVRSWIFFLVKLIFKTQILQTGIYRDERWMLYPLVVEHGRLILLVAEAAAEQLPIILEQQNLHRRNNYWQWTITTKTKTFKVIKKERSDALVRGHHHFSCKKKGTPTRTGLHSENACLALRCQSTIIMRAWNHHSHVYIMFMHGNIDLCRFIYMKDV